MKKVTFKNLIRQNTGSHFLDSGSAYGYKYNQPLPKLAIELTGDIARNEISGSISLLHYFESLFTIDQDLTQNLRNAIADEKCENNYNGYADYFKDQDYKRLESNYTFSNGTDLDQDFQYTILATPDGLSEIIIIESHNGCDARGGFSAPVICEMVDRHEFYTTMVLGVTFLSVNHSTDYSDLEGVDDEFQVGYTQDPIYNFNKEISRLLHWDTKSNSFTALLKGGELVEGYLSNSYVD